MKWSRVLEGLLVSVLLVLAVAMFTDRQQMLRILTGVDPVSYAIALGTTLGGILIWSGTLSSLLRAHDVEPTPGRFQVSFVAGMGIRNLVPGGATTGPIVLGYAITRANEVDAETSIAMAYVLEVFLWVGTAVVGLLGFVLLVLSRELSVLERRLAMGLLSFTVIAFAVILYGIRNPDPIERTVEWIVTTLHDLVQGHSAFLEEHLDASVVEERLDRFFAAFRLIDDDPLLIVPGMAMAVGGWFVHALTLYFVFVSLEVPMGIAVPFVVVPVAGLTEGLSMLPGGIGVFEPTFVFLLLLVSPISVPVATSAVILYRLSNYWFRIGLGFASVSVLGLSDLLQASFEDRTAPSR
ncbi:MAG: YbhN family protein [Halodesulfurarchaeum sp.]